MKKVFLIFAALLSFATTAFAQLGSLDQDLVFIPITPCRIFDTRPSQGGTGAIPAAGTKNFIVSGTASYAAQGGASSNCGVVDGINVAAAAINMTVVSGGAAGFITAFPLGATKPLAATVNYGANDVRGNMAIVKVSQTGGLEDLSIYSSSQTDVIGDIVGYYSNPRGTAFACSFPPENTLVVAPGVVGRVAIPACTFNISGATPYCTTDGLDMVSYGGANVCAMKNMGATPATITAGRRCCGVPGSRAYP
jgi:hypothetical protein